MTPDQCFNEMAKVLGFTKPEDTGYIAIMQKVKEVKSEFCSCLRQNQKLLTENKHLEEKNKELKEENDDLQNEVCRYSNAIEEEYVLKPDYEEQEKVLNDYQKVIDYMAGHTECDVYHCHSQWIIEDVKELKEQLEDDTRQVHQLFKENEELEERLQEGVAVCEGAKESMEEMLERINELEQENKELNEQLIQKMEEDKDKAYNKLLQEYEEVCEERNARMNKEQEKELEKEVHNYKKGYERIKKEFKTGIELRDKIIEESKKLRKEKNEWREKAIIYSNKSLKELQS